MFRRAIVLALVSSAAAFSTGIVPALRPAQVCDCALPPPPPRAASHAFHRIHWSPLLYEEQTTVW